MMRCLRFACLVLLALCFAVPAMAQSAAGMISGRITDPSGAVVPGAEVALLNVDRGTSTTTTTNKSGIYVFSAVQPGQYRMTVQKAGFRRVDLLGVLVNVQSNIEQNFRLAIGSTSESVTVRGGISLMNTTDASVSTVIDRHFVENIPMNGRSFQSLIELTPGVVAVPGAIVGAQGEFSVNGQRTESNYYTVDGVSANTGQLNISQVGVLPQETTLGTTQGLVSLDDLQEFRINTSTYSAQYGRMPGAQIAFETRSGTNRWHGSLFDYFRNNVLDANNWFNNQAGLGATEERQNDFGGTFGGPITIPHVYNGKNRTFFFFSYEGLRLRVPQPALTSDVPDGATRQNAPQGIQPFVNAFPIPNGPDLGNGLAEFTGTYSAPNNLDDYSIRVDQSFGDKLRVFGRFADTPSNSLSRNCFTNCASVSYLTSAIRVVTLGANAFLSPRFSNEFRFNYTDNTTNSAMYQDNFGGATPLTISQMISGITVPKYGTWVASLFSGTSPEVFMGLSGVPSNQWNIVDTMTTTIGAHTLTYGIDYRRQWALEGLRQLGGDFMYYSMSSVLANSADYAVLSSLGQGVPPGGIFTNFSSFIQDEWQVTPRFHLSYGLRWDINPAPKGTPHQPLTLNEITNLATATLAPAGTPMFHTDYHGFAPRIGLAYVFHQSPGGDTVIRTGFGVFYDTSADSALFGATGWSPGTESFLRLPGAAWPFTAAQVAGIPPTSASPPWGTVSATNPNLKMPLAMEWNLAIEQQLGRDQALTVTYAGSGGRRLLHAEYIRVTDNPNFSPYGVLFLETNGGTSDYNALEAQFQRRFSHGLEALASYTWSHSIDDESFNGDWGIGAGTYNVLLRGNSNFDIRQNFNAALTYNMPGTYKNPFLEAVLSHWSVDLRQSDRTALPVEITGGYTVVPLQNQRVNSIPDMVPGVPVYLSNPSAPGGRVININAFTTPAGPIGNEPRNTVRGFGAWQTDFAIQREFPIHESLNLQFRAEAFNLFNHPNFGDIYSDVVFYTPQQFGQAYDTLNDSLGGLNALYQMGGPRSMQLSLRLSF